MSWRGGAVGVERRTFEAVREILGGTDVPAAMDRAATAWLTEARSSWMTRLEAPIRTTPEGVIVDTFAGESVNRSILRMLGVDGKTDGVSMEAAVDLPDLRARATHALNRLGALLETEAATHAQAIRLAQPELTAPTVLIAEARQYKVDEAGIRAVLELISH